MEWSFGLFEAEAPLQSVQVGAGQQFFVLEASDDDAWRNAELGSETLDGLSGEPTLLTEFVQSVLRDEEVGSEGIRLLLLAAGFLIGGAVGRFDEDVAFAVFEDVGGFMEESEPKK